MRRSVIAVIAGSLALASSLAGGAVAGAQVGSSPQSSAAAGSPGACSGGSNATGAALNDKPLYSTTVGPTTLPSWCTSGSSGVNQTVQPVQAADSSPTPQSASGGGSSVAPASATPQAACPPPPSASSGFVGKTNGPLCIAVALSAPTLGGSAYDVHIPFTVLGFAFSTTAPAGTNGLKNVEVFLNPSANQTSYVDLGAASEGTSNGVPAPAGFPSDAGFTLTLNPQSPLPISFAPWPTGGNLLLVTAYGINGGQVSAGLPLTLR